jgi:hypothetical protein
MVERTNDRFKRTNIVPVNNQLPIWKPLSP